MKKILTAFCLLLICCTGAYAATKPVETKPVADIYHDWFAYYYFAPDPDKIPEFLKWLQANQEQDTFTTTTPAIDKGFLSAVFGANPDKASGWAQSASFSGTTKSIIDYALKPPVAPEAMEVKNLADLDMAWGAFFATGKDLYLKKIVDVLDTKSPLEGGKKQADAIRTAAAFSLGSNTTQHEIVERYLTAESQKRSGAVGDALKTILKNVHDQRLAKAFKHRVDEFSATLFVTDPELAKKEFSAASGGAVHLKEIDEAKPGDKRTIAIMFAGQQLGPDLQSDVTYDAQITDPEGKVYTDQKGLVADKGKVPTRFRVYFNKQAMFLNFDDKDTPGKYLISVTLTDNIGKKSIPLTSEVTFRK